MRMKPRKAYFGIVPSSSSAKGLAVLQVHCTPLHSTPLQSTPLHSTPLHSTSLKLHSAPLHSTSLSPPVHVVSQYATVALIRVEPSMRIKTAHAKIMFVHRITRVSQASDD